MAIAKGRMGRMGRMRRAWLTIAMLMLPALPAPPARPAFPALQAQHAAFRVKGRVTNERGEPIPNADVRLEAFFGYAAGTFSGPRLLSAQTNAKGEWSVGAMQRCPASTSSGPANRPEARLRPPRSSCRPADCCRC